MFGFPSEGITLYYCCNEEMWSLHSNGSTRHNMLWA
jgi:hypothetical protein